MTTTPEKSDQRNFFGVKDSADLYRTIGGVHFGQYSNAHVDERVAAYRAAGIRFRRIRYDGVPELFVANEDWPKAREIDAANGWQY